MSLFWRNATAGSKTSSRRNARLPFGLAALGFVLSGATNASAQPVRTGGMQPGEVAVIRVAARNHGLREFELKSRPGPSGRLVVEGFTAALGGGRITGVGQVDFANAGGVHAMRVRLENVDAAAFLRLLEVQLDAVIQARVDGEFDLRWRGTSGGEARRSLSGSARWKATPGFAAEADAMKMAAEFSGIAELRRFDFTAAGAEGEFRDGKLTVSSLRVAGPDQEVTGTGAMDISTRQLQMQLRMRIAPELISRSSKPEFRALGTLAKKSRDSSSGKNHGARLVEFPMPLMMTGELGDPKFQFGTWSMPSAPPARAASLHRRNE